MKKTYKFELPQNKELKSANTRVEDGKLFVDVEFQEKFDPKDGDFLYCENVEFLFAGVILLMKEH